MIKVLYAGSPAASERTLEILLAKEAECGFKVAAVLTNPPKARSRHKQKIPTAVATLAREHSLPVIEAEHLGVAAREEAAALGADILVSFAYGRIFGPKFLSIFPYGALNFHPSSLPAYRGPSPIPHTILNGEKRTSFCVQLISLKMDEGDIVAREDYALAERETSSSLLEVASKSGGRLLCSVLKTLSETGSLPPSHPQTGEASYTSFITKDDAKIDWRESADKVERTVRAYFESPLAWTLLRGELLNVIAGQAEEEREDCSGGEAGEIVGVDKKRGILVKCGTGVFAIETLQKRGRKAMSFKDFVNGERELIGSVLGR